MDELSELLVEGAEPPKTAMYPSHFVWAPEVHDHYQEVCAYRLISTSDASAAARLYATLGTVMRDVGLASYCAYYIFGPQDAFVRTWTSHELQLAFLEALRQRVPIDDTREFKIGSVYYSFRSHPIEPGAIDQAQRRGQLKAASSALLEMYESGSDPQQSVPDAVLALEKLGLLIRVPQATGLKVYFILQARSTPANVLTEELELERVINVVAQTDLAAWSVYACQTNNASYLIKGVAPGGFESLAETADQITNLLARLSMKTWTIPIPSRDGIHEFDALDSIYRPEDQNRRRFIAHMAEFGLVDVRYRLNELDAEARRRTIEVFSKYDALLEWSASEQYFETFFAAGLENDPVSLAVSESFLLQIEPLLREYTISTLEDLLGEDWLTLVGSRIDASKARSDSEGTFTSAFWHAIDCHAWGLKQTADFMKNAVRYFPDIESRFASDLFPDWKKELQTLWETRNRGAHDGTLLEAQPHIALDIGSEAWENYAGKLFTCARFYSALRKHYRTQG